MKKIVIIFAQNSHVSLFSRKSVHLYAKDVLKGDIVVVSITYKLRPLVNRLALVCETDDVYRILEDYGPSCDSSSFAKCYDSLKPKDITRHQTPQTPHQTSNQTPDVIDAITVDCNDTYYRTDAISFTRLGQIIYHIVDLTSTSEVPQRLSELHKDSKTQRVFQKSFMKSYSFDRDKKTRSIGVNLSTREVSMYLVHITDNYSFDDKVLTLDEIRRMSSSYARIISSVFGLKTIYPEITRPTHDYIGYIVQKMIFSTNIDETLIKMYQHNRLVESYNDFYNDIDQRTLESLSISTMP